VQKASGNGTRVDEINANKGISEEFTDSPYSANGRICIIQNGPQETCCIYIHMRQVVKRLRDRAWKND